MRLEKEEFWNPKIGKGEKKKKTVFAYLLNFVSPFRFFLSFLFSLILWIDELVIGISEAYAIARSFRDKSTEKDRDFSAATEDFVRKNEKYFIKPEGIFYFLFFYREVF